MKTAMIIVLAITAFVLCFFQWKGCQQQRQAQAAANAAGVDAARWKAHGDSADRRIDSAVMGWGMEKAQWSRDSARMVDDFGRANTAVNQEKVKLGGQLAQYNAAKALEDTAGQLLACDSITTELARAKVAVTDLQISAEGNQAAFGNEIRRRDSTINILGEALFQLRTSKDSLAAIAISQAKENARLSRVKHWAVGPSAGSAYIAGRIQPIIGVTATYSIFRF
jgi:hypothetical protein